MPASLEPGPRGPRVGPRGPAGITSAATRVDQGTVLVPAFIAVLLGPDIEVGADAMSGALATLDEPKQRGLAD